jgi:hypothetical protein
MRSNLEYQESIYQSEIANSHDLFTNITKNTNQVISNVIAVPLFPIQLVTTFVLGLLAHITFGLFLWLGSAIWVIFLVLLLATSWLWLKIPLLRIFIFFLGICWAVISSIYATLMPCMGELDARKIKLDLCHIWPLSWSLYKRYKS